PAPCSLVFRPVLSWRRYRLAIVGGRNIGDEYFGASDEVNFVDLDFAMIGPVVRDASVSSTRTGILLRLIRWRRSIREPWMKRRFRSCVRRFARAVRKRRTAAMRPPCVAMTRSGA